MPGEIVITDLRQCHPQEALETRPTRDSWTVYPYESALASGYLLYAHHNGRAPDLTLPCGVTGWHKVFLGVYCGHKVHELKLASRGVRIRLSEDLAFQEIGPEAMRSRETAFSWLDMYEIFWKAADMTGQDIVFGGGGRRDKTIAFVRLVPMNDQEIEQAKPNPENRRLIAHLNTYLGRDAYISDPVIYDSFGFDPARYDILPLLRDSDFHLLLHDICWYDCGYYPTKLGTRWYSEEAPEVNSLGHWVDDVHDAGLQIYSAMRLGNFMLPFETGYNVERPASEFFLRHPQFWQKDANGVPLARLSLAYPEVREHLVNVWREQFDLYPFDGVHIMFNRCWPFVVYEDLPVKEFQDHYGKDPRSLENDDSRWLDSKAAYITQFVGQVRAMLDEVGGERQQRLGLAIRVLNNPLNCRLHGLNIPDLITKGWVDYLIPHPTWSPERVGDPHITPQDISQFAQLSANSSCQLCPDVYPRQMPASEFRTKAANYYAAGADGLAFWDTETRFNIYSQWKAIATLGHSGSLESEVNRLSSWFRKIPLVTFNGFSMDPRYSPQSSG